MALTVTGTTACKTLDLGTGEAQQTPRARGERRRHTITNGVDCSLVRGARTLRDSVVQKVGNQGETMSLVSCGISVGEPVSYECLSPILGLREDRQSQAEGGEAP